MSRPVTHFGVQTSAVCVEMFPHCRLVESLTAQEPGLTQVTTMATPRSQIPTTAAAGVAQKVWAGVYDSAMREC
jgi:hypothetical protein